MSLDGFISGPGGDMSWLAEHLADDPVVDDVIGQIGAILVGRRTFDGDDPNRGTEREGAFQGAWDGPQVVLTHRVPDAVVPGVTFAGALTDAVAAAKDAAGDRYVNILGAEVARQCLQAGLLDEILVFVAPVLLGAGTRLFSQADGGSVRLVPISQSIGPVGARLWFRVA
jgi:dihydrofolate reductase